MLWRFGQTNRQTQKIPDSNKIMSKNIFDKHKTKIAKQTLRMSDVGAVIMGGMTKDEARVHMQSMGWCWKQIKDYENN